MPTAETLHRPRSGDLGSALVAGALQLLAQDGAEALSLRALARHVGVSAMAPYRYFPDKGALLAAVAERGFRGLNRAMAATETAARASAGETLAAQGATYVRYALDNPSLFRLMFGPVRCGGDYPDLRAAADATYATLARCVARAYPKLEPEPLTQGCWSLAHGLACLFLDGRLCDRSEGTPEAITRRVTAAMLGLLPSDDAPARSA